MDRRHAGTRQASRAEASGQNAFQPGVPDQFGEIGKALVIPVHEFGIGQVLQLCRIR